MKYFIIILFTFCSQVFAFEQDGVQVIRVTDKNNELVTGAKIEIPGTHYVYYTNIRGEAYIPSHILRQFNTINIHCISYRSMNINTKDISSKVILEFR